MAKTWKMKTPRSQTHQVYELEIEEVEPGIFNSLGWGLRFGGGHFPALNSLLYIKSVLHQYGLRPHRGISCLQVPLNHDNQ